MEQLNGGFYIFIELRMCRRIFPLLWEQTEKNSGERIQIRCCPEFSPVLFERCECWRKKNYSNFVIYYLKCDRFACAFRFFLGCPFISSSAIHFAKAYLLVLGRLNVVFWQCARIMNINPVRLDIFGESWEWNQRWTFSHMPMLHFEAIVYAVASSSHVAHTLSCKSRHTQTHLEALF